MIEEALRALETELGPAESAPVPLGGGQTNSIYRVRFAGRECVVRLPGKDTALLGIDRETERAASLAAAAIGVGPEVLAARPYLVTEFIGARPVPADELRARLPEVAAMLRAIHAGPALPTEFSPFELTARYERTARERGGTIPASYPELRAAADAIESVMGGPRVPCHNDLLTANFLDDDGRLRLLDWEYAGMNDPHFDLANFASHHDLEPDAEVALLDGLRRWQPRQAAPHAADGRVLGGHVGRRAGHVLGARHRLPGLRRAAPREGARAAGRPRRLAGGSPCRLTARRPTVPAA